MRHVAQLGFNRSVEDYKHAVRRVPQLVQSTADSRAVPLLPIQGDRVDGSLLNGHQESNGEHSKFR